MNRLMALLVTGLLLAGVVSFAQEEDKPKTFTLVLEGAMCGMCAKQMAEAIEGVDGAKVLTAPKKGTGPKGLALTVITIGGDAKLGAVATAIEEAETPHAEQVMPDVIGVIPGKVKPGTTPEALMEALKKAGLMAE